METKEVKKLISDLNTTWNETKEAYKKQEDEIKKYGESLGETKSLVEKLEKSLEQLETKLNRPLVAETKENKSNEAKEIFIKACRYGRRSLTEEEQKTIKTDPKNLETKTMTVQDDTTGGYFAMPEIIRNELLEDLQETSPIRQIATVRTTSNRSIKIRKKSGHVTAYWTGELASISDIQSNWAFQMIEIPVYEMTGRVDISTQDLDDADYNFESDLREESSTQFGNTENTAFVSGNGANRPQGILTNGDVSEVANGHASELQADALIDLFFELKTPYLANSSWILRRSTLKEVRKLKDGNGQYLWAPNLEMGKGPTILDKPYLECSDVPAIAASAYPIVFGDFKKAYRIVDRKQIDILRDPYTQAASGTVRFIIHKRVGAQVILPEAIKKLKIATTV